MLLDDTRHIVVHIGAYYQSILRLAIHGLCIDVILFLIVLHQPTLLLEFLEIGCCFLVNARIIFAGAHFEVYLWLNDMIQAHFIVASFFASFLRIQYVVWTRLYFLHQFLRWTYTLKWFDDCHVIVCLLLSLKRIN